MLRYFLFTQEGTNLVGGLNKLHCRAALKGKTRQRLSLAGMKVGED